MPKGYVLTDNDGYSLGNRYYGSMYAHNSLQTANTVQSMGGVCIHQFAEGDVVGLCLSNHTNTNDFTVEHANLSLVKIAN